MEKLATIIIVGIAAGLFFDKINAPGGAIVGAMAGSGATAILLSSTIALPHGVNTAIQIILGISIGLTFDASFFKVAPKVFPIAVVSTLILLGIALLMTYLASRFGIIDFGTALFGFSPGGMGGMAIVAKEEGYNTSAVAFIHIVRVFTLFVVVPMIVRLFYKIQG